MQVSVEAKEGFERCMTVEVPAEQVNKEVEKRLKKIASQARLDGFRPGKAPVSVIRSRYDGQVREELFREMLQSTYLEALSQEKLQPAGKPRIEPLERSPQEGFGYTATFEVMPEVVLKEMADVTIKRPVARVEETDIDEMVEKLRMQRAAWVQVDRAAEDGDQIMINFKGYIDDKPFEGGSADNVPLRLGADQMIDGFEAGLVGIKAGESRTLELTFPEDYQAANLAGKAVRFEVEATKVSISELPEIDEEFAKIFSQTGNIAGLRGEIRANMERELKLRINAKVKEQAMQALLDTNNLEVPAALVEEEAAELRKQAEREIAKNAAADSPEQEVPLEAFMDSAKRRVSLGLIMGEVIKANNLEVDADRLKEKVEQVAADYEDPKKVVDWYYSNKEQLSQLENVVLEEQVVDWVLGQVKVENEQTSFAGLTSGAA